MTLSEAARLVKLLASYWPSAEMPAETAVLWAKEMQPHDTEDVLEAIEIIGPKRQWMPSLAELMGVVRECRTDRLSTQTKALPAPRDAVTFGEFLRLHPDWADRVKALDDRPWPLRDRDDKQPVTTLALGRIIKGGL